MDTVYLRLVCRYWLLPHLYTLFYLHSTQGSTVARSVLYCAVLHCTVLYCTVLYCTVLYCTVARPLWHEFPSDPDTWDLDTQFLWGAALMVSPVLEVGCCVN